MLELSALGLLQREPLHGYRLKQQLELFMSSCISVNYGAIYPLLQRLEMRGYIETIAAESGETGVSRKIYGITAGGRDRLREKMMESPHESWVNSRSRFAIKFFFFGDLEPEARCTLMERRLQVCQLRREAFETQSLPEDFYQKEAWLKHLSMLSEEVRWLTRQLAREKLQQPQTDSLSWGRLPVPEFQLQKDRL